MSRDCIPWPTAEFPFQMTRLSFGSVPTQSPTPFDRRIWWPCNKRLIADLLKCWKSDNKDNRSCTMTRPFYYFLRILHVRIVFRLPFFEFALTICDAFSVPQMTRNHQYVCSHVTNQHLCVGWIIEIDIVVHVVDEIEEITLNGKNGDGHFKHIVWLLQNLLPSVYSICHLWSTSRPRSWAHSMQPSMERNLSRVPDIWLCPKRLCNSICHLWVQR